MERVDGPPGAGTANLVLRDAQLEALRRASWQRLAERLSPQLRQRFPVESALLGALGLREVVSFGARRAAVHGFHDGAEVSQFIVLLFLLGAGFDADPLLPWAQECLLTDTSAAPRWRMNRLYDEVHAYLERVAGRHGEHYRQALRRVCREPLESLDEDPVLLLTRLYPERMDELGEEGAEHLLQLADRRARHHGLATRAGTCTMALFALLLGSRFDRDPVHPWIHKALAVPADQRPRDGRLPTLHRRAVEILEAALTEPADGGR